MLEAMRHLHHLFLVAITMFGFAAAADLAYEFFVDAAGVVYKRPQGFDHYSLGFPDGRRPVTVEGVEASGLKKLIGSNFEIPGGGDATVSEIRREGLLYKIRYTTAQGTSVWATPEEVTPGLRTLAQRLAKENHYIPSTIQVPQSAKSSWTRGLGGAAKSGLKSGLKKGVAAGLVGAAISATAAEAEPSNTVGGGAPSSLKAPDDDAFGTK